MSSELQLAVLRTILYADVFSFAMTPAEIHHFLIDTTPATADDVQAAIVTQAQTGGRLTQRDGFVCLAARPELIELRQERAAISHALLPVAALGAAMHAQAQGWGLLPRLGATGPVLVLVGLLSMDLLRWLLHVAMHRLPWLWRLHSVHHSDTDYDCTIGLRFHPLEALLSAIVLVAAVSALGVPPGIVVLSETLTLALGFFAHGNVSLPPRWDRVLRLVLVTADTHRVHHSCLRRESMSNFGSVFSSWDRLFGTYTAAPAAGPLGMSIGLAELRDPAQLTLARLLVMPFRRPAAPGSEPGALCRPGGRGLG